MKPKTKLNSFYLIFFFCLFFTLCLCHPKVFNAATADDVWFLNDILAKNAWTALSDGQHDFSSPTIVAVIDTGCDYNHSLIKNALWVNKAEQNGIAGIDDDGNGYVDDIYGIDTHNHDGDPMDDSVSTIAGHGTHVAGCILQAAGVTETSNPFHIQLMPIKAGDAYGNFHAEDVAEALRYAADNGASVINLSISSLKSPLVFEEALEYASKSAIIVASSGNQGAPTSDSMYTNCGDYYPAAYPYVVGIMSYGQNRRLSDFSNWDFCNGNGVEYEIAAPGEAILSCTYKDSEKTMSGTSMSAGIVSGCAALLVAKYAPLHSYSAKDLTAHLMSSGSEDIAFTDLYGKNHTFRSINMPKLLSNAPKPNITVPNYSLSKNNSNTYSLSYTVSNKGCGAQNINVSISADLPEAILQTAPEPLHSLSALSSSEGNISISLPDNITADSVLLTIQISYENGSNLSDKEQYTCIKEISIPITPAPPNTERQIPLTGITVSSPSPLIMKTGDSVKLAVSYLPENTTDDKTLTFHSSAPSTAMIDETGTIFAKKAGAAKITVTSSKQHIRQVNVLVYDNTDNLETDTSNPILTVPESLAPENAQPLATIKKGSVYTVAKMKYKITNARTDGKGAVTLIGTTQKKRPLLPLR